MKYLIKQAIFEYISDYYRDLRNYFNEINTRISVIYEYDSIYIDIRHCLLDVLEKEFINGSFALNLIKKAFSDGFTVHYYTSPVGSSSISSTGKILKPENNILDKGFSYASVVSKLINKSETNYWIILYYVISSGYEDIKSLWSLIDSKNHLHILRFLNEYNNVEDTEQDNYYIAEISYANWIKVKDSFSGFPVRFVRNDQLEGEVKTSKPNDKYYGYVISPSSYRSSVIQLMDKTLIKSKPVFIILDKPIETKQKAIRYMAINYKGCYDKFKLALNLPDDIEKAESMIDMGFND